MAKKNDGKTPEEKAMERANKLAKDYNGELVKQKMLVNDIANAILGIDMSSFYEPIKLSNDTIIELKSQLTKVNEEIKNATATLDQSFLGAIKNSRGEILGLAQDFSNVDAKISEGMVKAIQTNDFGAFYKEFGEEGIAAFKAITKDKGFADFDKFLKRAPDDLKKQIQKANELSKTIKDGVVVGFKGWDAVAKKIADNMASSFKIDKLWEAMKNFDQAINTAQRNTGINFDANTTKMTELTTETARFGLSVEDTAGLMGTLGTTLRTTDFNILGQAAKDMAAMARATGMSVEEVGDLGGQMMIYGRTSKEVAEFAGDTMKTANLAGINGKKALQDIGKNLEKFKKMGFQGGEESLKRMVIQANRLGQNIDEIFDMSDKARNIEGALEMAAELQLAGGSFANINPMDLLAAARKGPEELQKILTKMGADIGSFNKTTGELELDAVDFDRLNMVAKTTGWSVESLRKQLQKTAEDNQKMQLVPQNLLDGISPEQQTFLMNAINMKDKKLTMGLDGIDSIDDLSKLTPELIDSAMKSANKDKENLEAQALQNTSLMEAKNALIASVTNLFTIFQPVIAAFTDFINYLNSFGPKMKTFFAGLAATLFLLWGPAKQFASGFAFGKGQSAAMKASAIGGGAIQGPAEGGRGAGGGWMQSLAAGLKAFGQGSAQILKGAATLSLSTIMIGASLIALTAGIAAFGGDASGGQLVTFGISLVGMAGMLYLMSKIVGKVSAKDILMGSLAMTLIGAAMIPFAFAAQMMAKTDWGTTLATVAIAMGTILGLTEIGALLMTPAGEAFLIGAIALVGAGIAMAAFGGSLLIAAAGFKAMQTVDWSTFGAMGSAMMSFIPSLLGIAGAGIFAIPGLLLMTATLAGFAGVMTVLAPALGIASKSIGIMASGVQQLKEAISGLDTSTLESLADISERMAVASAFSAVAGAVSNATGGSKKESITVEPITINLELDGATLRKIQTKTLNATKDLS